MTPQQLLTVKTAILADPLLAAQPMNSDGDFAIADALNLIAVPDFFVWRTSVTPASIMQNGFDWTRVDNLTVGKSRIWEYMMQTGVVNPSLPNVRAGVNAVFTTAADQATRQAAFNHCQRIATRIEKLLATGTGTTTTDLGAGPAVMGFEGPLDFQTVTLARRS